MSVRSDGEVQPEQPGGRSIRLLTGNLLSGGVGRSRGESRFEPLMKIAAAQDADLACFQECLYFAAGGHRLFHRAEAILGMRGLLGMAPSGQHVAVFVRAPLLVAGSRMLPTAVWHHGAFKAEIAYPRAGAEPGVLTVASVHLSPSSPAQRLGEAEQLVEYVESDGFAVIAGDTNTADHDTDLSGATPRMRAAKSLVGSATPDVRPIARLTDAGFFDAAALTGKRQSTTGHWAGHGLSARPDRILLSPTAAAGLERVSVVPEVAEYSDHLWLTADLLVPRLVLPDRRGAMRSETAAAGRR